MLNWEDRFKYMWGCICWCNAGKWNKQLHTGRVNRGGGGGGDYTTNCTQLVWYVFMPYSKEVHCSIPGDWWWFSCVCCSTCGREFDFQIITTTFHHERWDHRKKELDCIYPPSITNLLDTFSSAMCWRETLVLADQTIVSQGRIQTHDSSTTSPLITTFTVTLSTDFRAKK